MAESRHSASGGLAASSSGPSAPGLGRLETVGVLARCRGQGSEGPRVFEISTSFETAWWRLLKCEQITNFCWHDLRHHFASRLVQHGVPLNTVRDLPGHSLVAMSLRYAHLAPDQRCGAVAKLDERPLLAITVRLPWRAVSSMGSRVFEKPSHSA
jgi:Phage integrase family